MNPEKKKYLVWLVLDIETATVMEAYSCEEAVIEFCRGLSSNKIFLEVGCLKSGYIMPFQFAVEVKKQFVLKALGKR